MLSVRASSLPLVKLCPAAAQPALAPINASNPAADLGSAFHAWMAWCIRRAVCVSMVEHFAAAYMVDPNELRPLALSGQACWERLEGYFPNPVMEETWLKQDSDDLQITGHPDLYSWLPEVGEVRVLDWKTGWQQEDHEAQMRGYAVLALDRFPQAERVYAAVVRVRDRSIEGRYFERDDLLEWWRLFKERLEQRQYNPGEHCYRCQRQAECPARTNYLARLCHAVITTGQHLPAYLETVTAEQHPAVHADSVLAAHDKLKAMEHAVTTLRDLLKAEVKAAGGSIRSGARELRIKEQEQRRIRPREAMPILTQILGPDIYDVLTISKTEVTKKVSEAAPRGQKSQAEMALMGDLEAVDAIDIVTIERLESIHVSDETRNAIDAPYAVAAGEQGLAAFGDKPGQNRGDVAGAIQGPGATAGEPLPPHCAQDT